MSERENSSTIHDYWLREFGKPCTIFSSFLFEYHNSNAPQTFSLMYHTLVRVYIALFKDIHFYLEKCV